MRIRPFVIALGIFTAAVICIPKVKGEDVDTRISCLVCQADDDNFSTEYAQYCRVGDAKFKRKCGEEETLCYKLVLSQAENIERVTRGCTIWNLTGLSQDIHVDINTCRYSQQAANPRYHSSIFCYCDTDLCNKAQPLHPTMQHVLFFFRNLVMSIALHLFLR